jgi:hypothetical protein
MQLLLNEKIEPSDEVPASLLAEVYPIYAEFISAITGDKSGLDPQWKYYKDGHAWLCKIVYKKKTVSWLSIWDGFFKVTIYFSKKNVQEIDKLQIKKKLIKAFHETVSTKKYPHFTFEISRMEQFKDLLTIMDYKKKSK